jgi:Protein of unknown function (DUF2971)
MAEAEPDAKEPEVVYHYTSIDTMMKIVDSASIWATSISYLNDVSEREHYLRLIRERIPVYRQSHSLPDESIFDDFLNESDLGFQSRPFVASFSEEDDSLPQWRSYCPHGNGVAIGFRVECLRQSHIPPGVAPSAMVFSSIYTRILFRKIDYLDASSVQSLDEVITAGIDESMRYAEEERKSYPDGRLAHGPRPYFNAFIEGLASFKKHPSFLNEHEYRLLVDPIFSANHYLEFRATRSTLIPFIRVSIPRKRSRYVDHTEPIMSPLEGRWDFVDRVVIGPTSNNTLSLDAVSAFFLKNRMQVEVVSSAIPYRDW